MIAVIIGEPEGGAEMIKLRIEVEEPERATKAQSEAAAWRLLLALAREIIKAHGHWRRSDDK